MWLPPLFFLSLASLTLTIARCLYRWQIIRFHNLHWAFLFANNLCRIGLASWRHRRASFSRHPQNP